MTFRRKTWFEKLWLKLIDRSAYRDYKNFYRYYLNDIKLSDEPCFDKKSQCVNIFELIAPENKINFSHSGNAGDIIYALPSLKQLFELTGAEINLYLKLNQPLTLPPQYRHPLGNVMLNSRMAEMLIPLIESQPYISKCDILSNQYCIALDHFRTALIPMDKGNIARWCGYSFCLTPQAWKPWLSVAKHNTFKVKLLLARSERYRNRFIDFSFLNQYHDIAFIGVRSEYEDMKKKIPGIEWIEVGNFLEMAQIIAASSLFIGNQSFPYSIAEGLKVKRILETSNDVINVVPEGENGYEVFFQEHFEQLVSDKYIQAS